MDIFLKAISIICNCFVSNFDPFVIKKKKKKKNGSVMSSLELAVCNQK